MNEEELRRRMYGPKLRVVPDPLAFPNPEPGFRPLSSFAANPVMTPSNITANVADMNDKLQAITRKVDEIMMRFQAGIITIAEARAEMGKKL
jgi:hypothetical protein